MNHSVAIVIAAALIGGAVYGTEHLRLQHKEETPLPPRFHLVTAGESGIAWRLDTLTGDMVACYPFGKTQDGGGGELAGRYVLGRSGETVGQRRLVQAQRGTAGG